jgi:dimethylhistidine N-methyltransferase
VSDTVVAPRVRDFSPEREDFLAEVLQGFRQPQKTLPCKFLYDERGSELFEQICDLEEYYPTRTEIGILRKHIDPIAAALGPRCLVVEYGSGSGRKTQILLEHLVDPVAYVPIDISRESLEASALMLRARFPRLEVLPVCADYHREFSLPEARRAPERRCVFFPGSTIGNFDPEAAVGFLRRMALVAGANGQILIGVDLKKERAVLEAAYDDREGVTAAFNLNLIRRIREELQIAIPADSFRHRAPYNQELGRVEMHLVCERDFEVSVRGEPIRFRRSTPRTRTSTTSATLPSSPARPISGFSRCGPTPRRSLACSC